MWPIVRFDIFFARSLWPAQIISNLSESSDELKRFPSTSRLVKRRSQQPPPNLPQRSRFPRHLALDEPCLPLRRHLAERAFHAEKLIERNVLDNAEEHPPASRARYVHHRLRMNGDSPDDGFGPPYSLSNWSSSAVKKPPAPTASGREPRGCVLTPCWLTRSAEMAVVVSFSSTVGLLDGLK